MDAEATGTGLQGPSQRPHLTDDERAGILQRLLQLSKDRKLEHGAIQQVSHQFAVSRVTVWKIWKSAKQQYNEGKVCADVSARRKGSCGRKRKDQTAALTRMRNVPVNRRGTFRSLAAALSMPKSTLFDMFRRGNVFRRVSSTVKPYLTAENKVARVQYCLAAVRPDSLFDLFYDHVHIDEKWFYLSQIKRSLYLMLDEEPPHRTCKSKRFITKVMFLAAVARPRYDPDRKQYFDGKLGIWPFVTQELAKRNSKNRPKGTLITKPVESVDAAACMRMLTEKVFPAIRAQFPVGHKSATIYVQQDNAKPHSSPNDAAIIAAGACDGWTIQMKQQPPNSPDLNVLDLGFFNSIQSLQHQAAPNTVDELITCVKDAYAALDCRTLDNVFLTLQSCMEATMMVDGCNSYRLAHLHKAARSRTGQLPLTLPCSQAALQRARVLCS